jgi:hypothetical protein
MAEVLLYWAKSPSCVADRKFSRNSLMRNARGPYVWNSVAKDSIMGAGRRRRRRQTGPREYIAVVMADNLSRNDIVWSHHFIVFVFKHMAVPNIAKLRTTWHMGSRWQLEFDNYSSDHILVSSNCILPAAIARLR